MSEPENAIWDPVDIPPHGPTIAPTALHHRHNSGAACSACHIISLRARLAAYEAALVVAREMEELLKGEWGKDKRWVYPLELIARFTEAMAKVGK